MRTTIDTERTRTRLVLAYNNASLTWQKCPLCGSQAGSFAGGSAVPLEIFEAGDLGRPVCPSCAAKHAPELAEARERFYGPPGERAS